MSAFQDLTGQKFGRLTVLHRAEDFITKQGEHQIAWICQCDCGNQITARSKLLKAGKTKSCGCLLKDVMKNQREDLTGQKFGRLTVLREAEDYVTKQGNHKNAWICECECGNQITVRSELLKSGRTKSCGCLRKDIIENHRKDLTGQKFGKLTVLRKAEDFVSENGRHRTAWICQCDCGNQITVRGDGLKSGSTRSCGCLHEEVMKSRREDLTGQVFGRLTVIGPAEDRILPNGHWASRWNCQCECGKQVVVSTSDLNGGRVKSCGGSHARRLGNEYDLTGDYGIGYTRKGEPFWFDKEDFNKIKNYTWWYDSHGYVATKINVSYRKPKEICLHVLIMGPPPSPGMIVDHKNHPDDPNAHKIDNRKSNLRFATRSQNSQNSNNPKPRSSGHVGVYFYTKNKTYLANITKNYQRYQKSFPGTPEGLAAAIAWRKDMEVKLFGDFRYSAHNPDPDLAAASAPAGAPGSEPGHGDAAGRETAAPA